MAMNRLGTTGWKGGAADFHGCSAAPTYSSSPAHLANSGTGGPCGYVVMEKETADRYWFNSTSTHYYGILNTATKIPSQGVLELTTKP